MNKLLPTDHITPIQRTTGKRNLTNDLANAAILMFIVIGMFGVMQAM